jgi:hypothetical protein
MQKKSGIHEAEMSPPVFRRKGLKLCDCNKMATHIYSADLLAFKLYYVL